MPAEKAPAAPPAAAMPAAEMAAEPAKKKAKLQLADKEEAKMDRRRARPMEADDRFDEPAGEPMPVEETHSKKKRSFWPGGSVSAWGATGVRWCGKDR